MKKLWENIWKRLENGLFIVKLNVVVHNHSIRIPNGCEAAEDLVVKLSLRGGDVLAPESICSQFLNRISNVFEMPKNPDKKLCVRTSRHHMGSHTMLRCSRQIFDQNFMTFRNVFSEGRKHMHPCSKTNFPSNIAYYYVYVTILFYFPLWLA